MEEVLQGTQEPATLSRSEMLEMLGELDPGVDYSENSDEELEVELKAALEPPYEPPTHYSKEEIQEVLENAPIAIDLGLAIDNVSNVDSVEAEAQEPATFEHV